MSEALPITYTVGHSTRSVQELVDLLKQHGVKVLVDVRTVPKSRTNPQFNRDALATELPRDFGIKYEWRGKDLGGLRKPDKGSTLNAGWDNQSFRGYADHMQSEAFSAGLEQLLALARARGPVAIMCAEVSHYQCHRRCIADALSAHGITVQHITAAGKPTTPHQLTGWAKVDGTHVTYPAYQHETAAKKKRRQGPLDAFVQRKRSKSGSSTASPAAAGSHDSAEDNAV